MLQIIVNSKPKEMNRIQDPFIISEPSSGTKSYKPKQSNMEKFLTLEDLEDMTLYELKIIMLFHLQKGQKIKDDDAEENQQFNLSLSLYKNLFKNPNSYYSAIKSLINRDIISKVEGKQSIYRMNPKFINNLTYQQAINAGIKQDFRK